MAAERIMSKGTRDVNAESALIKIGLWNEEKKWFILVFPVKKPCFTVK
jgi:hypothetical protein